MPTTDTPPPSPTPSVQKGPSRDMLGGPVLGVVMFLLIAVILGWVATKMLQGPVRNAQQNSVEQIESTFDLEAVYELKRDVLLGWDAREQLILYPGKRDLPHGSPNRRIATRIEDYRASQAAGDGRFTEVVGIIEAGTQLRVLEVIDDPGNQQTRLRLRVELITGPQTGAEAIAFYLGAMSESDAGVSQYAPREGMIRAVESDDSVGAPDQPIQSEEPASGSAPGSPPEGAPDSDAALAD